MENWINGIAIVISMAAFVFSMAQFFDERTRSRKEATIHAFDKLEESEAVLFLFESSKREIDSLVRWRLKSNTHKDTNVVKTEEWEKLSTALPLIEHFAVGINNKIYDVKILNSMAGNQLISTWYACEELIKHKRNGAAKMKNYSEFERMVSSLMSIRKRNKQSIPTKQTEK